MVRPSARTNPKKAIKVERPFRYVRQDFFLGRSFRDMDDLNAQFEDWRVTIANRPVMVDSAARHSCGMPVAQNLPASWDCFCRCCTKNSQAWVAHRETGLTPQTLRHLA